MRVVYLSNGDSSHDRLFLDALVDLGHEAFLVSYLAKGEPYRREGLVTIHHRWTPSQAANLVLAVPHVRRLLKRIRPDVLHSGYLGTTGLLGALSGFRPHLSMPWGSDVLLETESWRGRSAARRVLRSADLCTVDAETVKDRLCEVTRFPREKVIVFPWGVDLTRYHPGTDAEWRRKHGLSEDDEVVLCARRFEPVYGHSDLFAAFTSVAAQRPRARLLLVGWGTIEAQLRELAQERGIADRVAWAGRLPPDELARAYRASDVYVSASYSDGTSVSLLEGMASGIPPVVTDIPAILEWVRDGDTGLVVPRGNPAAIAAALLRVLASPDLRADLGKRALAESKARADWEKNARTYDGMLRRLASSPPEPNRGIRAA